MKTQLSKLDVLLIRQCKKNKHNLRNFKKIVGWMYALYPSYVSNYTIVNALYDIVNHSNLITDWRKFIDHLDPEQDTWFGLYAENVTHNRRLLNRLASAICLAEVVKFDYYPRSSYWRNKEKN